MRFFVGWPLLSCGWIALELAAAFSQGFAGRASGFLRSFAGLHRRAVERPAGFFRCIVQVMAGALEWSLGLLVSMACAGEQQHGSTTNELHAAIVRRMAAASSAPFKVLVADGLSELPIVALTADARASERELSLAAGMNDFVSEPFDPRQLMHTIRLHVPLHSRPTAEQQRPVLAATTDWPSIDGIDTEVARERAAHLYNLEFQPVALVIAELSRTSGEKP